MGKKNSGISCLQFSLHQSRSSPPESRSRRKNRRNEGVLAEFPLKPNPLILMLKYRSSGALTRGRKHGFALHAEEYLMLIEVAVKSIFFLAFVCVGV
ncbi:hypothetical protein CEXT_152811 [Caerostris extrusa]|uniref:Uncharacterized protein n=1 Tax=Caerostris extrusa TaxID=172846 RepID=A0AAV4TSW1_CAEEX|nr:hypothetical protein CEXT_152811 [Caerostris extrusa]